MRESVRKAIGSLPFDPVETVWFRIPVQDGAAVAMLHQFGKVRRAQYDDNLCFIETEAPESLRRKLSRSCGGTCDAGGVFDAVEPGH